MQADKSGQNQGWHCDSGLSHATCEFRLDQPDTLIQGKSTLLTTKVWDHKDFQDRAIKLWEHWAEVRRLNSDFASSLGHCRGELTWKHYKNNTWVAGFNPLNEPADEKNHRLLNWYSQVEKAIRAVDSNHILFLE